MLPLRFLKSRKVPHFDESKRGIPFLSAVIMSSYHTIEFVALEAESTMNSLDSSVPSFQQYPNNNPFLSHISILP